MITKKVKDTIKGYGLISKGERIVVGVSGGPDSVALIYLLNSLSREFGLSLHIAHLDHMLRKDSRKDAEFVEKLAQKLKLPVTVTSINVKALSRKGSVEQIARNARLGFLFGVAKRIRAKKIALGHNLDDQAETVLMRILRGSGLSGLSGILPKREIAGFEIIRPLIKARRSQIEGYLRRRKIRPRIDASNLEDIYLRNRIRNYLLPLLERQYSGNIREILSNTAQSLGYDYDYLCRCAARIGKGSRCRFYLNKLERMHPAIQRLLFRRAITVLKGNTRRIDFRHIREIEELILRRPVNSIVDLPDKVSAVKKKSCLYFYRRKF